MTINAYTRGNVIRESAVFVDEDGHDIDPTAVRCVYRCGAGADTTLTYGTDVALVRDSLGHYHVDLDGSLEGAWYVRWASTGAGQAAEETQFLVVTSAF
jgi:hypothetical protein